MTVSDEMAKEIVSDWFACLMTDDPEATVANLMAVLRSEDATVDAVKDHLREVDELRSKLSGWHFAKDALTPLACDILAVAERLMELLDGGMAAQ